MNLSNTQLDHLGDRLRDDGVPTDEDREMFESYRSAFDEAHRRVAKDIAVLAAGITESSTVTTRRKTLESTVAKLGRISTRLSQIEDIAGCRVVLDHLSEQDALLERAMHLFDALPPNDYRASPQNGYRAVHLVIRDDSGYRVEVQIRTESQDVWANMSESIAMEHDIDVKYGEGPAAVHTELYRASDSMFRYDQFQESPDGGGFLKSLPYLLEAAGAAASLQRVVEETWPEESSR